MTTGLMRRFSSSARAQTPRSTAHSLTTPRLLGLKQYQRHITGVRPRQTSVSRSWFTSSLQCAKQESDEEERRRVNERNLKLGTTIRTLHERLPTLLVSPLPQDILSPQISLHLFPSTHPHLPTVSGKIAYTAALWTAPVAWGRMPVVGNVQLKILSERLVKNGCTNPSSQMRHEKLIVRWQTCDKSKGQASEAVEKMNDIVADSTRPEEEFTGLFIFEFDEEGRIVNHTIEHTEEGHHWDMTTKFISVTDWLLGRAWGRRDETPSLAYVRCDHEKKSRYHRGR